MPEETVEIEVDLVTESVEVEVEETLEEAEVDVLERTAREHRHDFVAPYDYIGIAIKGSQDYDPFFTIYRKLIADNGTITEKLAVHNVKWTERLTITYE